MVVDDDTASVGTDGRRDQQRTHERRRGHGRYAGGEFGIYDPRAERVLVTGRPPRSCPGGVKHPSGRPGTHSGPTGNTPREATEPQIFLTVRDNLPHSMITSYPILRL